MAIVQSIRACFESRRRGVHPEVAQALDYLHDRGWNTLLYQTMQIMGVAWRGNAQPARHQPDPSVAWNLPAHLQGYRVSGE